MTRLTDMMTTRRGVLKGGAALGALATLAPALLKSGAAHAEAAREVISGSHWGVFWAGVEDGTWNKVRA